MTENLPLGLSFHEEEKSLGSVGDATFLNIRHRILLGQYAPGYYLEFSKFCQSANIPADLGQKICKALVVHGYLIKTGDDRYDVKWWSETEFVDALALVARTQQASLTRCTGAISPDHAKFLETVLDLSIQSGSSLIDLEHYYIRWWMFWQSTLSAYGLGSYRTLSLVLIPPHLRRRMVFGFSASDKVLTLKMMQKLLLYLRAGEAVDLTPYVDEYFSRITPRLVQINTHYNSAYNDKAIIYSDGFITNLSASAFDLIHIPQQHIGLREPLNRDAFEQLGIVSRKPAFSL
jgi:hypothetical protein